MKNLLEIWDSIKYDMNLNKEINQNKLLRQLEIFDNFRKLKGKAFVEACTRFGKTMIAIIAIKRMNLSNPNYRTIVVVPTDHLFNDWVKEDGHINTFNLKNVDIYVINSYVLTDRQWSCNLLVIDEVHRVANEDSEYFSTTINRTNFKFILGLSATLDFGKRAFLEKYGLKSAGKVTLQEAEAKGWIARHQIYNLGLELSSSDKEKYRVIEDTHDSNFRKLNQSWDIATACRIGNNKYHYSKEEQVKLTGIEWRKEIAKRRGWKEEYGKDHEWSPSSLSHYAQLWGNAMGERQSFLHNSIVKLETTVEILQLLGRPALIFSESTHFADGIPLLLEEGASFHSKVPTRVYQDDTFKRLVAQGMKVKEGGKEITKFRMIKSKEVLDFKEVKKKFPKAKKLGGKNLKARIIEDFNSGKIDYLSTVKSIDEGFDSDRAEISIIASGKSQQLQNTQRNGRSLNYVEGKVAIIINLYIKDTQDQKWLNKRQLNIPTGKIKWIDSIDQIEL